MEGTAAHSENVPDESPDPEGELWKVFVSSTSAGLKGFRRVARDVIEDFRFDGMKCFKPIVMERFGAQGATPREVCADEVRDSDLLVGIIGMRYGDHPADDQTSYTELEFQIAQEERIAPLTFLLDKQVATGLESVAAQQEDRADRQERFRGRVLDSLVVERDVVSEADFRQRLEGALNKWVRDYSFQRKMVDHREEFKAARRRLLSLRERTGGWELIFGEPGTGKTTLFNALLNDTLLKRSFGQLIGPVTVRMAEGTDEVKQQCATVQSKLGNLAAPQDGGLAALPSVLIALHLEPDIDTGKDVDSGTLPMLSKLFTWDVPRAVVLAETSNRSVKEQLERDLSSEPGTVTTLHDYVLVEDALEQMRRDAPEVRDWPQPDTRTLVEALGMRPIILYAAAKGIGAEASVSQRRITAVIRRQLDAVAHEESLERKHDKLIRGNIDSLSAEARELLVLMTVLHPKPTLFPDEMAVALDLSLELDEAIGIATAKDPSELNTDERRHLDTAYDLVAELVRGGLLERMPRQGADRDAAEELVTLHPAKIRVIHGYLPLTDQRRAQGHARAEAFYRARVGEAVSGSFDSRFRMESLTWWDDVGEWVYHLGHTTPGRAGISFATLFLDAYWWQDLYLKADFCDKLLDYASRPRVQKVKEMPEITRLLATFRETYPREHESTRSQILAELAGDDLARAVLLRETARTGAGILPVLQQLCGCLGITELDGLFADQAAGLSGSAPEAPEVADQTRLHLLGLICRFLAEGHRFRAFLDPAGTALATAEACYQAAESCFAAEDNAWDVAWTRCYHGKVVSARGGDPGSLWDYAAAVANDESDTELLGEVERVRADHLRAHGDLEAALAHYGRAVFYGAVFQVTSNLDVGADAYTQAFYREMRLHATKVLAEPLLAAPGADLAEARRRLEVMLRQWGGHWQPDPARRDGAFGSASRQALEGAAEAIAEAIADAAFFPGPGDAVLGKLDSGYYRQVNDLIEKTRRQPWVKGLSRWDESREKETG